MESPLMIKNDLSKCDPQKQHLCRLCAKVNASTVEIYGEHGLINRISDKINEYLPTKVSPKDDLPLSCCWECYRTLMSWHEFVGACADSEKKLKLIYGAGDVNTNNKGGELAKVVVNDVDLSVVKSEVQDDEIILEEEIILKEEVISEDEDECNLSFDEAVEDSKSPIVLKCEVDSENEVIFGEEHEPWEDESEFIENGSLEEDDEGEEVYDTPDYPKRKTPKAPHVCDVCNLKFRTSRGLQSHLARKHEPQVEDEPETSTCGECGKVFKCDLNLKSHIWNVHTKGPKVITQEEKWRDWELMKLRCRVKDGFNKVLYKCPECSKLFTRASFVINHQTKHTGVQLFQCKQCDKKFSHRQTLSSHVSFAHNNTKKYECKVCGAKFRKLNYLNNHVTLHSGVKNFVCDKCGKSFLQMGGLKSHLRTHAETTKKYEFECKICKKKFCKAYNLNKHAVLHTLERPYQCKICKAHFTTTEVLAEHLKKHSDPSKFFCQYCGSNFGMKNNLYKHEKNCVFRNS